MKLDQQQQNTPQPVKRCDYQSPAFLTEHLSLHFCMDPARTIVSSRFRVQRNPDAADQQADLRLDGANLELLELQLDGAALGSDDYTLIDEALIIPGIQDSAELYIQVAINPATNTALEGLYTSGDFLLTQCEAQGFRKITYFFDHPDVMCRYTVTIEADRDAFPVLLSNGNQTSVKQLDDNRQQVQWEDPFPKPSYLFALVAGDLACVEDQFVTRSGKQVELRFFVESGSESQCAYAIGALQRAMRWDEQRFGLEYDLDVFNVVVTHDFNMGAMENKSLNIFNSRYVLADQETATDADFQAVEGVIGHEYFHNWTGNRVTCRDWFQLTLKEGLTVFRDQEFSADMQSRAVQRIGNVAALRQFQFPEDAGPMAHPIRPDEYLEINNFYTATVYQKGAEVIRMYHTLLGQDGFRKGMDLYFQRHDGQAVTCDDFLAAMADANDTDLSLLGRWYSQSGTPRVQAKLDYDVDSQTCKLTLSQHTEPTADQQHKQPLLIPVAMGLLDAAGNDLPLYCPALQCDGQTSVVLPLTEAEQCFEFKQVPERPLPSLLREFSAPVQLHFDYSREQLAVLMAADSDSFNRWDAAERLQLSVLLEMVDALHHQQSAPAPDAVFLNAFAALLEDTSLDPALVAAALSPVSADYLSQQCDPIDIDAITQARQQLQQAVGQRLQSALWQRLQSLQAQDDADWSLEGPAMARRSLYNTLLYWVASHDDTRSCQTISQHYHTSNNMTDRLAALRLLVHRQLPDAGTCLQDFADRYQAQPLVMDKWFAIQASQPQMSIDSMRELMSHPAYKAQNPNKIRAVVGAFAHANPDSFHCIDGSGYQFIAGQLIAIDEVNPQVAARLAGCFNRWIRFDPVRKQLQQQQLQRIAEVDGLSPDLYEVVSKSLQVNQA